MLTIHFMSTNYPCALTLVTPSSYSVCAKRCIHHFLAICLHLLSYQGLYKLVLQRQILELLQMILWCMFDVIGQHTCIFYRVVVTLNVRW